MKIELPHPEPVVVDPTYYSPGITSPYAEPPLAPVFIVGMRDGGRITFTEDEGRAMRVELDAWLALVDQRRAAK